MSALHSGLVRLLGSAALVVVLAVVAVPSAYGAKPDRSVLGPSDPFISLAGQGCAFDVLHEPSADARRIITQFDDGRTVYHVNGNPKLTNLGSGATFDLRARFHSIETYDPASNSVVVVTDGQVLVELWPGDQGPYGEVAYPGLVLRVTGISKATLDLDTFVVTSFSLNGRVTDDVCAELAR